MVEADIESAELAVWAEGIEGVHARIAGRFGRVEPRLRVLDYLKGLVSSIERKNGWQLAEQAGDLTPDGVQRLLASYDWDADLVRDDLRRYVAEHLGHPQGVLVILVWTPIPQAGFILAWSRWRRRHQARAKQCHYRRRLRETSA